MFTYIIGCEKIQYSRRFWWNLFRKNQLKKKGKIVGPYCALAQKGSPKYRNLWFRYISWWFLLFTVLLSCQKKKSSLWTNLFEKCTAFSVVLKLPVRFKKTADSDRVYRFFDEINSVEFVKCTITSCAVKNS